MVTYLIIIGRLVTIMGLLLLATLFIMGKRPIGEMPVFDFLVLVVMGSIVGADIADPNIEHLPTAFSVVVLAGIQRLISLLNLKYRKFRKIITFEPTVVVHNGKLIYKNIKRIHYSADEVLMMLRENQHFDISQIEYGIIEANGKLSTILKPEYEQATRQELSIPHPRSSATVTVILDGNLQKDNVERLHLSETDIFQKLKSMGHNDCSTIFYATMDAGGTINASTYQESAEDFFAHSGKDAGPKG